MGCEGRKRRRHCETLTIQSESWRKRRLFLFRHNSKSYNEGGDRMGAMKNYYATIACLYSDEWLLSHGWSKDRIEWLRECFGPYED